MQLAVGPDPRRFETLLYKTELCTLFWQGRCFRKRCRFAHGEQELRTKPDFTKTVMCHFLTDRGFCRNRDCKFAHDLSEIRSIQRACQVQARRDTSWEGRALRAAKKLGNDLDFLDLPRPPVHRDAHPAAEADGTYCTRGMQGSRLLARKAGYPRVVPHGSAGNVMAPPWPAPGGKAQSAVGGFDWDAAFGGPLARQHARLEPGVRSSSLSRLSQGMGAHTCMEMEVPDVAQLKWVTETAAPVCLYHSLTYTKAYGDLVQRSMSDSATRPSQHSFFEDDPDVVVADMPQAFKGGAQADAWWEVEVSMPEEVRAQELAVVGRIKCKESPEGQWSSSATAQEFVHIDFAQYQ
mmetsp:Transcript_43669/g.115179  ORF Transcript_43669/g.115179 Transcript_43669/m.115179 type:complete len:350 (+) Transcript_43669:61-1110(+)